MQSLQDDVRSSERQVNRDIKNMIEMSGSFDFKQVRNSIINPSTVSGGGNALG